MCKKLYPEVYYRSIATTFFCHISVCFHVHKYVQYGTYIREQVFSMVWHILKDTFTYLPTYVRTVGMYSLPYRILSFRPSESIMHEIARKYVHSKKLKRETPIIHTILLTFKLVWTVSHVHTYVWDFWTRNSCNCEFRIFSRKIKNANNSQKTKK